MKQPPDAVAKCICSFSIGTFAERNGLNMEPKLMAKANLQTKTRLETLYLYVFESLQSFGVDAYCFDTLRKGLLERKIIKAIHVKYKNKEKVIVGEIVVEIDWDKYEIATKTDYGATFTFDTSKSLREQLSQVTSIIDAHVRKIREEFKVDTITTSYTYINDISKDPTKNMEAMNYLGHVYGEREERRITGKFKNSVEYICEKLSEVKITINSD